MLKLNRVNPNKRITINIECTQYPKPSHRNKLLSNSKQNPIKQKLQFLTQVLYSIS